MPSSIPPAATGAASTPHPDQLPADAVLRVGVGNRAQSVLALLAARTWPGPELQTLTAFLRTSVLSRLRDETAGMSASSLPMSRADRDQLWTLTERLEAADPQVCPRPHLRQLVEDLLTVLDHCPRSSHTTWGRASIL